MNVVTTDWYGFSSDSRIDTFGEIHTGHFNPFNPRENLLSRNDDGCGNHQFKLVTHLHSNTTYVLIVTTYISNVTGAVLILASGPKNIVFKRISEYLTFMNNQYSSKKYKECFVILISTVSP